MFATEENTQIAINKLSDSLTRSEAITIYNFSFLIFWIASTGNPLRVLVKCRKIERSRGILFVQ